MTFLEALSKNLRAAAQYNASVQVAPAVILWPDKDSEWLPVLMQLQAMLPELFSLGAYALERRQGPAVWLKCVIAGVLPEVELPKGLTPIIYLPGVSRQDLKAITTCPAELQPLAELQYRGALWSQVNAKDWTVNAFLVSTTGGLGLDVAQDGKTHAAMRRALEPLLSTEVAQLQGHRLEASDFNQLLTTDAVRDVLTWMCDAKAVHQDWAGPRWEAFVGICHSEFRVHPERDGELVAAENFCAKHGAWARVWQRFVENTMAFARLPNLLVRCQPDLAADVSSYPGYNLQQEGELLTELQSLVGLAPAVLRERLLALETYHGPRRDWIWAGMGLAPLAQLLEPLALIATLVGASGLSGTSPEEMAEHYRNHYWQVDDALLRALAMAREPSLQTLVQELLGSLYTPWLHETAVNFQELVRLKGYPGSRGVNEAVTAYHPGGEVVFFVDGLRYDVAQRFAKQLQALGEVRNGFNWSALPSVTATAKAAIMPIHDQLTGRASDSDFQPSLKAEEKSFSGHYFRKLMEEAGWQVLAADEVGDPQGRAWVQTGNIDEAGHTDKLKLAGRIDTLLQEIYLRVEELLQAGWRKVRIVTDHGWLLTPQPMSKVDLPKHLTEIRWARCAEIKDTVQTGLPTVNWHWSPSLTIAVAPGASAFLAGRHYDHGGLSLQECLTPILEVINTTKPVKSAAAALITRVRWLGLTCKVEVQSSATKLFADLRISPADASTSIARPKPLKEGKCSLMVEDDSLQGEAGVLVVLDEAGNVLARQATLVGDEA
jgi:hypothetical protein